MAIGSYAPAAPYRPGEVVRVVAKLDDPSGVVRVVAAARNPDRPPTDPPVQFRWFGMVAPSGEVVLEGRVEGAHPPGRYVAAKLTAIDALGNRAERPVEPSIAFDVSHTGVSDPAAPDFAPGSWGFTDTGQSGQDLIGAGAPPASTDVANLAALRSLTPAGPRSRFVHGHTAEGDGGEVGSRYPNARG